MIYKGGKGASVYYNSGFKNYGCLIGLILLPFQIILIAIQEILKPRASQ